MVRAYHVIFTAYGFWLPNDPRGSWSDFVGAWQLFRFGGATKTTERASLAGRPHDRMLREGAKQALKRPAVHFTGVQAQAVGAGFAHSIHRGQLLVWACSILPEHVHLVVARHTCKVEVIVNLLKGAATRELLARDLHPFASLRDEDGRVPHCWARGEWKVFLSSPETIRQAIQYVEENPVKEGKLRQRWSFVTAFDPRLLA